MVKGKFVGIPRPFAETKLKILYILDENILAPLDTQMEVEEVNHPSLSGGACSVRSEGNWLIRRH